ncbi:MAG: right-handed parallel beta-helix repeat-containing protein [Sedimentisphaeraceae bacterium JB056]
MKWLNLLLILVLAGYVSAIDIYVSPDGKDSADGSLEAPYKTIQRARDQLRHLKSNTDEEIAATVYIKGGTYELTETLEFNELDSGTEDAPIVYRNYAGQDVHIVGGRLLNSSAFSKVSDDKVLEKLSEEARENVLEADLKEMGIADYGQFGQYGHVMVIPAPMELFFGGNTMQIARYPNEGYVHIGKVIDKGSVPRMGDYSNRGGTFEYTDPRHEKWAGVEDIWLQGTFNNGYSDDNIRVESIDPQSGQVKLAQPYLYGLASGRHHQHYYAYNILCELDSPGEYYINRNTGKLYFWPPSDINSSDAVVSMFDDPIIAMEGVEYITLEGLTVEASRGIGIYVERANNNTIAGCTVRNTGTSGIFMGMGAHQTFPLLTHNDYEGVPRSRRVGSYQGHMYLNTTWDRKAGNNNKVISCDIYNTGSGGIQLSGGSKRHLINGNSEVVNCKLYNFNRRNKFLWAGINVDGCGNRIANCDISDSHFQAIYVRGNEHVFEYNYIHQIAKDSDDTSAWYLGRDPSDRGNIVRYNFFYDVGREDRSVMGVYCDDATTDVKVIGNIFYKVGQGRATVFSNAGQDLLVKNNIFVDCGSAVELSSFFYTWGRTKGPHGQPQAGGIFYELFENPGVYPVRLGKVNFKQPPYSEKYPGLTDWLDRLPDEPQGYVGIRPRRNLMINNVLYNCKEKVNYKGDYAQFETKNNFVADKNPGFVDLANLDMRLKDDSVVYDEIPGFERIPFEKIGLYDDEYRKSESDKYSNEPSSGKELEEKTSAEQVTEYDPSQDMSLSPQQRKWELTLKENLGDFYYPIYLRERAKGTEQAWDYVEDDPKLPRMLVIGDSISRGYTLPLRHSLEGKANVHRAPANCGPTTKGLEKLSIWLDEGKWDIISFNFGIHDRNTPLDVYNDNLRELVSRLKKTGAKLVWVSSTPIPPGADIYVEGAIDNMNAAAEMIMKENEIPIINLHDYIQPVIGQYQLPNNCHYKSEGYEYMGHFLASQIEKQLQS